MDKKLIEPDDFSREDLLDVLEDVLNGGLKAIRGMRDGKPRKHEAKRERKKSNTEIVRLILTESGVPLHINEIIRIAGVKHGVKLNRESIVSALTKKVLDENTFCRTGRNEFALLDGRRP